MPMMPTVTVVRLYLVAVFLVAISLIASGCGDTASVNPAAELASLTVTPGTLQPVFSGGTTQYNVDLSNDITSVTITAQPADGGDTVTINNQTTTNSVITLGAAGTTTSVPITVSGSGTTPRTYTVNLVRASFSNSLQSLAVSPGTLAPSFNMNTLTYTVDVANNVGSINVTPTVQDPAATMTVNGKPATSGQASTVTLNNPGQSQTTAIPIVVKAQNGNEKTYTVTVSRGISSNSNLQSLTISPGTLTPRFSAGTTGYTVHLPASLPSNVTSVTVTPTLQDTTATMTVNGQAATSGQPHPTPLPSPGSSTVINIVVTAQNRTQTTYSVNVIRTALGGNNNLSALTVRVGTAAQTLSPTFSPSITDYTVNVRSTVSSVTVTATLQDTNATMTIEGQGTRSGQGRSINLGAAGTSTDIDIVVTAQNTSKNLYRITVIKAAPSSDNDLSALSVRVGTAAQTLSPTFAPSTTAYTVNVATDVTEVTVSATKDDPNAVMAIGSVTVPAGTATGQTNIPLNGAGNPTSITITVTAQDGSPPNTYTITVNRAAPAAPPAPTSAPDLIKEDDSCPPVIPPDPNNPDPDGCSRGTSRSDNRTSVTTPRFSIAPPAGLTPSLYVDGKKDVSASFDSAANILMPSAALSEGAHEITYTLTNVGGESPQSPSLAVTIDTVATAPP